MQLTDKAVRETIIHVLYRPEEVPDRVPPKDAVLVRGLVTEMGFHPGRLQERREDIRQLLAELPDGFMKGKGGGWSFLNMSQDRHGREWGSQRLWEDLLLLGLATGMANYCLPREQWGVFLGNIPYIMIDTTVP